LSEDVEDLRHAHNYGKFELNDNLREVFDTIKSGRFGDADQFSPLVDGIVDHGDFYLVSDDFQSYCDTQDLIDKTYKNQDDWLTKCILSVARTGFFTSDRCMVEYADEVWSIEPLKPEQD